MNDCNCYYFVYTNSPDSESHLLAIYEEYIKAGPKDINAIESIRKEWDQLRPGYYEIRKGMWTGSGKLPEYNELTYVRRLK